MFGVSHACTRTHVEVTTAVYIRMVKKKYTFDTFQILDFAELILLFLFTILTSYDLCDHGMVVTKGTLSLICGFR